MVKVETDRNKRSRTLQMLYCWGKFVGIVPLTLSVNNKIVFSYFGLFYGCFLCIAYSDIFYRVLIERFNLLMPGETPISIIVDFIGIISGFIETSLTWLVFGLCQKRIKLIVKSFAKAEKISSKLGIPEDYEKHFRKLGLYLTIVHILYVVWKAFNIGAMGLSSNAHIFIWTCYIIPRVDSFSTWTLFIWSLAIAKQKFRRLNDKVRFLMQREITSFSCNAIRLVDKIRIISQLHRELRDVIYRIEGHFALVILLNIVTQFTNITFNVHVFYRFLKYHFPIKGTDVMYLCVVGGWVFIPVIVLAIISDVCGSTVDEANETGNILHAIFNNFDYLGNRQAVQQLQLLSLDLLQNPVKISLFGFFDLNSFLVYSTIATATTYLTIMLQFYS